ncbi:hypothetical protein [Cohnella sp. GCM10027633]|uniref:hypothetical protein n=1 Tax=unclassified Cohnella TaxID=2636738 RepID=UPI0036390AB0
MNDTNKSASPETSLSQNDLRWLSPISALIGMAALWAVWHFYGDALDDPEFRWYHWIQPILMTIGSLTALAAAPILATGRKSGWEWFKLALSFIPIILAARLVIVVFVVAGKAAGKLSDGSFFEWLSDANPVKLTINIAIIIFIIMLGWLSRKSKSGAKENKDADGS